MHHAQIHSHRYFCVTKEVVSPTFDNAFTMVRVSTFVVSPFKKNILKEKLVPQTLQKSFQLLNAAEGEVAVTRKVSHASTA